MAENTYFEVVYEGPWKGIDVSQPENKIERTCFNILENFILKNSEIKTRPQKKFLIPNPADDATPFRMIAPAPNLVTLTNPIFVSESKIYKLNTDWIDNPATAFTSLASLDLNGLGAFALRFPFPWIVSTGGNIVN